MSVPASLPPWPMPRWVAHRGAGLLAPENTLAAFRAGWQLGYRAFECDVKCSADGVPFLLHDATLERTTTGHGRAADQPWAALSQLDAGRWHSPRHAGEPIPTLAALAAFMQACGCALNIEIKPTPGQEAADGSAVAEAAARLWSGAGPASPLLFSSFQPAALRSAQAAAPQIPRALLLDELRPSWPDETRALGCIGIVCNHRRVDAALVAQARSLGLHVGVYTPNAAEDANRVLALGVATVITDAVDRFPPTL